MLLKSYRALPHGLSSAPSINSDVYGPSHEEGSILLQVPAMTSSVHPRDLEDSLLLQTISGNETRNFSQAFERFDNRTPAVLWKGRTFMFLPVSV
uniref:Uncharacterized protein n=1 Tax=Amphilophus citrinellus TaxID=61819 RepID=A0A3Q0SS12_AMPCI